MNLLEILQGANIALKLLQTRIIVVICLLFTAAIYGWAMWLQTQLGVIIAAAWSVLVFLPVLYSAGGGKSHAVETKHDSAAETGSGTATRPTARLA